jgi:predicted nucleic acid-binding protein
MMVRIFLDACIVIDLVEGRPEQQDKLKSLIAGKRVFGSELVRMESRLQALRDEREGLLAIYDRYFDRCEMIPFDRTLFDLASRLRVDHRVKTPDALHLAAALTAGCDQFWTNDSQLAKAAGTQLEVWDWSRIHHESLSTGQKNSRVC